MSTCKKIKALCLQGFKETGNRQLIGLANQADSFKTATAYANAVAKACPETGRKALALVNSAKAFCLGNVFVSKIFNSLEELRAAIIAERNDCIDWGEDDPNKANKILSYIDKYSSYWAWVNSGKGIFDPEIGQTIDEWFGNIPPNTQAVRDWYGLSKATLVLEWQEQDEELAARGIFKDVSCKKEIKYFISAGQAPAEAENDLIWFQWKPGKFIWMRK